MTNTLTSNMASVISALSKLTLDKLAPVRFVLVRLAYLKLTNLRSNFDKSAPEKFKPCNKDTV